MYVYIYIYIYTLLHVRVIATMAEAASYYHRMGFKVSVAAVSLRSVFIISNRKISN